MKRGSVRNCEDGHRTDREAVQGGLRLWPRRLRAARFRGQSGAAEAELARALRAVPADLALGRPLFATIN